VRGHAEGVDPKHGQMLCYAVNRTYRRSISLQKHENKSSVYISTPICQHDKPTLMIAPLYSLRQMDCHMPLLITITDYRRRLL